MEHITVGKKYNEGKIAFVDCPKNDDLKNIDIKGKCFLLLYLSSGSLKFSVSNQTITATAPCFVCFNELENPTLISKHKAKYLCVYFHPKFLNVNMTFEFLRSRSYDDIATVHDMFLLKPFLDGHHIIPVREDYQETIENACIHMAAELREQRDWYWSCRGRSYFMEVIIALERMYGLIGYGVKQALTDMISTIKNSKLRNAVLFIESHYAQSLTLSQISDVAGVNHTSLTKLFKSELGVTAMEYLMQYRVKVAKKQLSFTDVPLKDIATRCGFKTVQHFSRVFKEHTDFTPADYRKTAVQKRKDDIK